MQRYLRVYTEASVISRTAAASTIFLMTNFLIALSLGTHLAQLVQRTGLTCPRLCLQRPPLRLFLVWNFNCSAIRITIQLHVAYYSLNNPMILYENYNHSFNDCTLSHVPWHRQQKTSISKLKTAKMLNIIFIQL